MDERPSVLVLGGGVCGLYAARTIAAAGIPVTVIEKEAVPGGLATGFERNGNFYDLGVHQLHTFDREIFEDIKAIMGERLQPVELRALIRYGDGYRRYPLEFMDILKNIPPWRLARALLGLAVQTLRNKLYRHGPADAEEALIRLYGRPLYEYFFRDFTHRYWGIPASALSATFVRTKMPRLSAVDAVKKTLARLGLHMKEQAVESALSKETVWYTPTGARELPQTLARFVEEHGGQVLLGASVAAVETDNDRVSAVGYDLGGERFTVPCSQVITTMPVTEFVRSFVPQPRDAVLDACDQLNYKPIAIYGLLVRRPKVLDALYIYFRGRVFHRVAEPKNSGLRVAPEDWTILIVEMTCDEGDDRWQGGEETRRAILRDLEEEGLVRAEDVAETHLLRTPYGYPIFKLGFERYHEELKGFLRRFENVQSVGRQGGFCYPNMHSAMRMGAEAARRVVEALGRTIPARQQAEQRAQR